MSGTKGFSNCFECGRIFASRAGRRLCTECATRMLDLADLVEDAVEREGKKTISDIATYTGLTENEVRRTLHDMRSLSSKVDLQEKCVRCGREPASSGMDLCMQCRIEMHHLFDQTTRELAGDLPDLESQARRPVSNIPAMLDRKRARTSVNLLFAPQHRVR